MHVHLLVWRSRPAVCATGMTTRFDARRFELRSDTAVTELGQGTPVPQVSAAASKRAAVDERRRQTAGIYLLRPMDEADEPSKRLLDCPEEILVLVASALTATPKALLAFGAAARSLKALLLEGDEASVLWDAASARHDRGEPRGQL